MCLRHHEGLKGLNDPELNRLSLINRKSLIDCRRYPSKHETLTYTQQTQDIESMLI